MRSSATLLLLALFNAGCSEQPPQRLVKPHVISEAEVVSALEKRGGVITRDNNRADGPVTIVSLRGAAITDDDLQHLNRIRELEWLDLHGTNITDDGLMHLRDSRKLKTLYLNYTDISDSGLAHLKGLANLEALHLIGTDITDSGLAHLKHLAKLRRLYLTGTKVTADGALKLKSALPKCKVFGVTMRSDRK